MPNQKHSNHPTPDTLFTRIADYTLEKTQFSETAYSTARYCLMDSLGCALLSLKYDACNKLLGPLVPGADLNNGARVPGTDYQLDPQRAAFNIGTMIRWLDYNDTWLAVEWGHPSDNLGGILAIADYICRNPSQIHSQKEQTITLNDILDAMIKAYEIQGILALENSFNRVGLDHVILVRVATTAVATALLGGDKQQIMNALSNAWIDGGALRTYRHSPNTGSRKSWAAGDATSRGIWHALNALKGEMGYPSAMSTPQWGFNDVLYNGKEVHLPQKLGSYVMENILFKISYPAEFHAQTAVEAAITLYPLVANRITEIDKVVIHTQQAAMRIINKTGPLTNPADRDHCLQYMVAIGLIFGQLSADDYEDKVASDTRIDELRSKMQVSEQTEYSNEYLDPAKRSIGNAVQVFFTDGTNTDRIEVKYPLGHKTRRDEAIPTLIEKYRNNAVGTCHEPHLDQTITLFQDLAQLHKVGLNEFMAFFTIKT